MGMPLASDFGEMPKHIIAKFGAKKQETLGYFPLADNMTISSAILVIGFRY